MSSDSNTRTGDNPRADADTNADARRSSDDHARTVDDPCAHARAAGVRSTRAGSDPDAGTHPVADTRTRT